MMASIAPPPNIDSSHGKKLLIFFFFNLQANYRVEIEGFDARITVLFFSYFYHLNYHPIRSLGTQCEQPHKHGDISEFFH